MHQLKAWKWKKLCSVDSLDSLFLQTLRAFISSVSLLYLTLKSFCFSEYNCSDENTEVACFRSLYFPHSSLELCHLMQLLSLTSPRLSLLATTLCVTEILLMPVE